MGLGKSSVVITILALGNILYPGIRLGTDDKNTGDLVTSITCKSCSTLKKVE